MAVHSKTLEQFSVDAVDGFLGTVVDFLVDEKRWTIRYLVVDTGMFVGGRRALISPIVVREVDWTTRVVHVGLSRNSVRLSPALDIEGTITRQHESDLSRYYGVPVYWGRRGLWGDHTRPTALAESPWLDEPSDASVGQLRSAHALRGFAVQSRHEHVGRLEDLIVDPNDWSAAYFEVDIGSWWRRAASWSLRAGSVRCAGHCASSTSTTRAGPFVAVHNGEPTWSSTHSSKHGCTLTTARRRPGGPPFADAC